MQQLEVRIDIPAWASPGARPQASHVRRDLMIKGVGTAQEWERCRIRVAPQGVVLTAAEPAGNGVLESRLQAIAEHCAEIYGPAAIHVEMTTPGIIATPDRLWAYRIPALVVRKPGARPQDWSADRLPAERMSKSQREALGQRIDRGLARALAPWAPWPLEAERGVLVVCDPGRPMPIKAMAQGPAVLARLGVLVLSHWKLTGALATGPLASVGYGSLEQAYPPRAMDLDVLQALAARTPDAAMEVV